MSVLLNKALQQNLWPVPKDNQYFVMYQSIFVYDTCFLIREIVLSIQKNIQLADDIDHHSTYIQVTE